MKSKVRLWLLFIPAALAVVVGWWLLVTPRPPDFTRRGFTSVRAIFSRDTAPLAASSNDPGVLGGMATALRSGRSTGECKCGEIVRVTFDGPDGTTEELGFVPAHEDGTIEFRWHGERFVLDASPFLKAVEPLGIPPDRWSKRSNEYR